MDNELILIRHWLAYYTNPFSLMNFSSLNVNPTPTESIRPQTWNRLPMALVALWVPQLKGKNGKN